MHKFFHGWKRKVGVVALLFAALYFARMYFTRIPQPEVIGTPRDVTDLRQLQQRVEKTGQQVQQATVAVETPQGSFNSGVIITPDGLVLSQYHVSHRYKWDGKGPFRSRQPGERSSVIFHDGRQADAELLGFDQTLDISLLQILDPGPHPHAPVIDPPALKLGDWVLKLGHPLGYQAHRPPVVRLGRVLYSQPEIFVTDCHLTGGDSGGPYFDLEGHLIGLVHSVSAPMGLYNALRVLGPPVSVAESDTFADSTSVPRSVDRNGPFSALTNRTIRLHLEAMRRGETYLLDLSTGSAFAKKYQDDKNILPKSEWMQGANMAEPFRPVVRGTMKSVVTILDESGQHVALGTIIGSDGWIVTVANSLPAAPQCVLYDGRTVAAEVIDINSKDNLAFLKVSAIDLGPVDWTKPAIATAGAWVAGVAPNEQPWGIGIVSVPPAPSHDHSNSNDQSRADRSTFFEVDIPNDSRPFERQCGGPVVDLDGTVIGIINRRTEYGCTVMTSQQIQEHLGRLKPELRSDSQ